MPKTIADWYVLFLCLQYAIVAVLYLKAGQPWKSMYWVAAAALNYSIIKMNG